nr:PREDICTED: uncharacterized protein LOC103561174 [Equus przewalskii]XP_008533835.1 PREDICTED: uncharacterized protein LOC103561174 [Equus przewalskii]XP_008533836.1 PREDICTED: uncharacterized protein LOC103561174 [Equus przewalskii]XP_008533837.1 PREDICTED: uncharacterized protein LOC103561174 [Equus przewalskii]
MGPQPTSRSPVGTSSFGALGVTSPLVVLLMGGPRVVGLGSLESRGPFGRSLSAGGVSAPLSVLALSASLWVGSSSLRDEPDPSLQPSKEGPTGRVGAQARAGPEPCDAASPQEEPAAELGARELTDLSAQRAPPERETRLSCCCQAEPSLIARGAVLMGSTLGTCSARRGTPGCTPPWMETYSSRPAQNWGVLAGVCGRAVLEDCGGKLMPV